MSCVSFSIILFIWFLVSCNNNKYYDLFLLIIKMMIIMIITTYLSVKYKYTFLFNQSVTLD